MVFSTCQFINKHIAPFPFDLYKPLYDTTAHLHGNVGCNIASEFLEFLELL